MAFNFSIIAISYLQTHYWKLYKQSTTCYVLLSFCKRRFSYPFSEIEASEGKQNLSWHSSDDNVRPLHVTKNRLHMSRGIWLSYPWYTVRLSFDSGYLNWFLTDFITLSWCCNILTHNRHDVIASYIFAIITIISLWIVHPLLIQEAFSRKTKRYRRV
jgi:hypothetical protein